jgi:hypothetical protein
MTCEEVKGLVIIPPWDHTKATQAAITAHLMACNSCRGTLEKQVAEEDAAIGPEEAAHRRAIADRYAMYENLRMQADPECKSILDAANKIKKTREQS